MNGGFLCLSIHGIAVSSDCLIFEKIKEYKENWKEGIDFLLAPAFKA